LNLISLILLGLCPISVEVISGKKNSMSEQEKTIVKPYQEQGSKKEQVTNMFDNIASKYDLLNTVLTLGIDKTWRRKAIASLDSKQHRKILDVATGTADVAIELNKQLKPDQIIGMDISSEMINFGQKKIAKQGLQDVIKLEVGDSEKLSYETNRFDAVTAVFGVRNFENLEQGLSEMFRVLRPEGKTVILEFSRPKIFPFKQIYNIYFKHILPFVGKKTSKDPKAYQYLYESVQAFPDYERFGAILEGVGFRSVQWKSLSLGICTIYTGIK